MEIGSVKRPCKGELHCGDQFGYWQKSTKTTLCIADGLGHGKHAEKAANAAIAYVANHLSQPLPEIFSGCNKDIHCTRGVVMAIAVIDENKRLLTYAGVGNTRALIIRKSNSELTEPEVLYLRSNFGIVGGGYKSLSPKSIHLWPGDLLIMYTDGVKEIIDVSGYDKSLRANVQQLAERVILDWSRETDDAAVLIYRYEV